MNKLISALLIALLFVSGSASAEWVKIDEGKEMSSYIDPTTIRKDGNLRKVWQIQDLKQREKGGELSRQARLEYDCKNERFRTLSISTHSEPMANGMSLFQTTAASTPWNDIPPRSVAEAALKIVCAR
jgi:hypothetical protein